MKKSLPIFLFLAGILVFGGGFLYLRSQRATPSSEQDETVAELPFEKRPFASLTPTDDGHWLQLLVTGADRVGASSMDYELLYKVKDGRTQGVPGSITLSGKAIIERELLLGSESSGKFRYDDGVEEGTLTLRFRSDKGKLIGKLTTDFHLQSGETNLTSVDGAFSYTLSKNPGKAFFVTMQTFGLSKESGSKVKSGPWGVFASNAVNFDGKALGSFEKVDSSSSSVIFVEK